jgi:hypothetical protein
MGPFSQVLPSPGAKSNSRKTIFTRASAPWGDQSYYFVGAANCTIAAGTGAHNLQPVFSRKDAGDEDAIAPNLDHRIAARDGVLTKLKLDHAVSSAGRRREFPKWPIRVPKGGLRTDSDQANAEAGGPGI